MKKKNITVILSLLFILVPFCINIYSVFRLLSFIVGLVLFAIILFRRLKLYILDFFVILALLFAFIFIDYSLCRFNRVSIFSYEVVSSPKVTTYYSLFYKVTSCDDKWEIDKFYKNNYSCKADDLDIISINDFISSYERNKKAYFRVTGKISKIVGDTSIELKPYDLLEDSKNGNVAFKEGAIINIPINDEDIKGYKVYDEVTIIGRVEKVKKENEEKKYNLTDIQIFKSNIYDNYDISFEVSPKCSADKSILVDAEDRDYYTSCISNILITYNENNIYDLDYLLLDEKITIEDLICKSNLNASDEEGNELYSVGDLKMLLCKNNDVVFGSKLSLDDGYCNISLEDEEEGV